MANSKKICKNCKAYVRVNEAMIAFGKVFCDVECKIQFTVGLANKERAKTAVQKVKAEKKVNANRKKEFRDNDKALRSREAQKAVNAYIRKRDEKELCISCQNELKQATGYVGKSGVNAGHYKSRGSSPELRFCELNIHSQCYRCNVQLSGNIENYRINLIKKIGVDKVDWLEGPHKAKKYTCAELKEIEVKYKAKLKSLS
jgi:hypothetical protein